MFETQEYVVKDSFLLPTNELKTRGEWRTLVEYDDLKEAQQDLEDLKRDMPGRKFRIFTAVAPC